MREFRSQWTRRDFLKTSVATGAFAAIGGISRADQREVDFLKEVQRPPLAVPKPEREMRPLLVNASGDPITSVREWEVERKRIRAAWLKFLGPMPTERPEVKLEVLDEDQPEGCLRQRVRYLSEADLPVEGYLLTPLAKSDERRAGIVALHQTNKTSIEEIAGVNGPAVHHLGLQLCQRGFVVFCPRCYLWENPPAYTIDVGKTVADFKKRHPGTIGMHKMLYDAQRGIDVLESLSTVDAKRIGSVGHSLGSKESFYLAAFDERIRAAVASEGGIGYSFTNWDDPWYLGDGINAPGFALDHHELIALIAPRAFLVLAGEKGNGAADGARTWPYLSAALPVYRLYSEHPRLGLLNHGEGHSIPPLARERMFNWLDTYLRV